MLVQWEVEVVRGQAGDFHARGLPADDRPHLWWFEVESPALVLGSAQDPALVDAAMCSERGVEVVRRRSGGGVVLLMPGEVVWFDLIIPRGHERWDEDIARAAWWVGEAACAAIGDPSLEVHRGPVVRRPWSDLVCFAGLGPGEVTRSGRKVLGLSQRRTRDWIRYQCAAYRRWDPAALVGLLHLPAPTAGELAPLVDTAELTLDGLIAALA